MNSSSDEISSYVDVDGFLCNIGVIGKLDAFLVAEVMAVEFKYFPFELICFSVERVTRVLSCSIILFKILSVLSRSKESRRLLLVRSTSGMRVDDVVDVLEMSEESFDFNFIVLLFVLLLS